MMTDHNVKHVGCTRHSRSAPMRHSISARSVQYGGKRNAAYCTLRAGEPGMTFGPVREYP